MLTLDRDSLQEFTSALMYYESIHFSPPPLPSLPSFRTDHLMSRQRQQPPPPTTCPFQSFLHTVLSFSHSSGHSPCRPNTSWLSHSSLTTVFYSAVFPVTPSSPKVLDCLPSRAPGQPTNASHSLPALCSCRSLCLNALLCHFHLLTFQSLVKTQFGC